MKLQFSLASIFYATTLAAYGTGVSKDFIYALESTDLRNTAQASDLKPSQPSHHNIIESTNMSSFCHRHLAEAFIASLMAGVSYTATKTKSNPKNKKNEDVNPSS